MAVAVKAIGESSEEAFRFIEAKFGEGNGLYYMRARYYSPEMGRFISKDPIGLAGGINMYAYVGNNPLNWIDPLGLEAGLGGGGTGLELNPPSGCGPNWTKVKTGIFFQFAGYGLAGGGIAIGGVAIAATPGTGGWSAIEYVSGVIHGIAAGEGMFATGGFFWWKGTELIYEGFTECGCK